MQPSLPAVQGCICLWSGRLFSAPFELRGHLPEVPLHSENQAPSTGKTPTVKARLPGRPGTHNLELTFAQGPGSIRVVDERCAAAVGCAGSLSCFAFVSILHQQ